MKKFVAFSFGALMALSFNACSDDDVANTTPESEDNLAYIHVNIITNDDTSTRADDNIDDVLVQGASNEHNVSEIEFYFFDVNKKFISMSEVTPTGFTEGGTDKNIESSSNDIVVVPKYNKDNPPMYVITVLNRTENLQLKEGADISEFYELADGAFATEKYGDQDSKYYTIGVKDDNKFVMTTTTYKRTDAKDETPYYTTSLKGASFFKTREEAVAANEYTTIYVERLAAKVGLEFSDKLTWPFGEKVFRLGEFDLDDDNTTETTLYAKFLGWGLNGTAKRTYYSKHIQNWDEYIFGDGNPWNDPSRYRSYWAESYYYTSTSTTDWEFPDKYYQKENQDSKQYWESSKKNSYYKGFALNFINANEADHTIGTPLYCGENTNSAALLNSSDNLAGVVTCALMLARLQKKDAAGNLTDTGDIIKYGGKYYDAEVLAKKLLNKAYLNGYKYTTEDGQTFDAATELTAEKLTFAKDDDLLNGRVKIQIEDEVAKSAKKWYTSDGSEANLTTEQVITMLHEAQGSNPMVRFDNGLMYYYTPIYHLSNKAMTNGINEGNYGVVRNHWYAITINGFRKNSNDSPYDPTNPEKDPDTTTYGPEGPGEGEDPIDPGHGVDDPDEPIVPTTEDVNFYLGTNIKILSWRQVNQSIKL
jgi:hypothetical protein